MKPLFQFRRLLEPEKLSGEKTFLRSPIMNDFGAWASLRQDSRNFLEKWEPSWSADEFSRVSFRYRLNVYEERVRNDEGFVYFIFDSATSELVGGLTLSHLRRGVSQSATLGYWVGEKFARRGFMTDAIRVIMSQAQPRFSLHRIEAACLPQNVASHGLLLKCGFEQEGYAKAYVKIAGQWEDHLLFGHVIG